MNSSFGTINLRSAGQFWYECSDKPVLLCILHDGVDALAHVTRGGEVEVFRILDQPSLLEAVGKSQLQVSYELLVRSKEEEEFSENRFNCIAPGTFRCSE